MTEKQAADPETRAPACPAQALVEGPAAASPEPCAQGRTEPRAEEQERATAAPPIDPQPALVEAKAPARRPLKRPLSHSLARPRAAHAVVAALSFCIAFALAMAGAGMFATSRAGHRAVAEARVSIAQPDWRPLADPSATPRDMVVTPAPDSEPKLETFTGGGYWLDQPLAGGPDAMLPASVGTRVLDKQSPALARTIWAAPISAPTPGQALSVDTKSSQSDQREQDPIDPYALYRHTAY